MPIRGTKHRFTNPHINGSPTDSGVYVLYEYTELIYIGKGDGKEGIRTRLQYHKNKNNPCTKNATSYCCERSRDPVEREKYLLEEYLEEHGKLPRCNGRIG